MPHHAYFLIADVEEGIAHACMLHGLEGQREGNPDVQILRYQLFGIEEARALQSWAYQRPIARERRVFIVTADSLTHETQNALLKLFEEPPLTSAFVLIMRSDESIIPTLRSRFEVVHVGTASKDEGPAVTFLGLTFAERLEEVAKRTKAKDVPWQAALLSSLETHFYSKGDEASLREIVDVERMISARGSAPKMLLEHLALALPRS